MKSPGNNLQEQDEVLHDKSPRLRYPSK